MKLCVTIDLALKGVLNAIWKDTTIRKTISIETAFSCMKFSFL
ncbi:MAG: hypothetical protein QXO28_04215 [Ignisphaera sp.]